ncbi:MAG: flavodoxin [Polyangiales bacterium]
MKKILVVCYSRTGSTARVGRAIASALGADFELIQEVENRHGIVGFVLSALESLAKGLPSIRTQKDPRDYDLVVIGTPVWAASMSAPVRSYLFTHRTQLPQLAFFTLMGGVGADDALRELKLLCQADDAPTYALTQAEARSFQDTRKFRDFIGTLAKPRDHAGSRAQAS